MKESFQEWRNSLIVIHKICVINGVLADCFTVLKDGYKSADYPIPRNGREHPAYEVLERFIKKDYDKNIKERTNLVS